jgi:hypothetical protein
MVEKRNMYTLFVEKPERKRPLGKQRRRCADNIRMDLLELEWGEIDWIGLAQDGNSSYEFGIEPSGYIKCLETMECPINWGILEWCAAP